MNKQNFGFEFKRMIDMKAEPMMLAVLAGVDESKFDYSLESLELIEGILNSMFDEGYKPARITTVLPFGIYLGQTLVQNIPGFEWNVKELTNPMDATLECSMPNDGEVRVKPLKRIMKFIHNREDGIEGFARMVKMQVSGKLDQLPGGEWADIGGGTMVRQLSISAHATDEELELLSKELGYKVTREDLQKKMNQGTVH